MYGGSRYFFLSLLYFDFVSLLEQTKTDQKTNLGFVHREVKLGFEINFIYVIHTVWRNANTQRHVVYIFTTAAMKIRSQC